jgi:hypothetical protein
MMELAGQGHYKQLAEEIGEVLQAAAETADRMQEEARVEAARIRAEAEAELRAACSEGRRILDDARTEADAIRAEAEWQGQEILAAARRQAAECLAGADARLAQVEQAENRVLDRLAGVGQLLSDALATLRRPPVDAGTGTAWAAEPDTERPTAKVYFVEFPPAAPAAAPGPAPASAAADPYAPTAADIPAPPYPGTRLDPDQPSSEWAPPAELPAWWTRGGAQG